MIPIRLAAIAAALALLVGLLIFGPAACSALMSAKTTARVARGQGDAAIASGAEATAIITNLAVADAATDTLEKEGLDAIHTAGDDGSAAALDAACRLRLYSRDQRCAALRGSGPAGAAGTR